jgi:flavin-dependent dehydrogenase
MVEKYDIAVVGGGAAGLSTALSICKKTEASVLIVEKGKIGDPKKTSPFTFPDVVKRFGLSDAVLQEYRKYSYVSPNGLSASFKFEKPVFATIDYEKMCETMLRRAANEKGTLTVFEKVEALDYKAPSHLFSTRPLEMVLSNSTRVVCNVLVDASGSSFFVANKLGMSLPALYSHPYGEFLEECKIEDPEEMCIFTGNKYGNGGGWLYPIGKKAARFGFATITRSRTYPKDKVESYFKKALRDFYPYNEMLAGSKSKRREFGTIPIGPLKKLVIGQILIVGDAAGQATPWYNEGVRPALEGGQMCGETIVEAYKEGEFSRKTLMKYQHVWDDKNRRAYAYSKMHARYFKNQEQWDNSVRYYTSLTPCEMMGLIRHCHFPRTQSSLFSRNFRSHRFVEILKEIVLRIRDRTKTFCS